MDVSDAVSGGLMSGSIVPHVLFSISTGVLLSSNASVLALSNDRFTSSSFKGGEPFPDWTLLITDQRVVWQWYHHSITLKTFLLPDTP